MTTELVQSGEVKVTIERTTLIFLPSFPADIDIPEDIDDSMDPVAIQLQDAWRLRWIVSAVDMIRSVTG